jgi:hypothetical protein
MLEEEPGRRLSDVVNGGIVSDCDIFCALFKREFGTIE